MLLDGDSIRTLDVWLDGCIDWIGECIREGIPLTEDLGDWALIIGFYDFTAPRFKVKNWSKELLSLWKASGCNTKIGEYKSLL